MSVQIDKNAFHECAVAIQEKWKMTGLSGGMYEDYAREICVLFLEKMLQGYVKEART